MPRPALTSGCARPVTLTIAPRRARPSSRRPRADRRRDHAVRARRARTPTGRPATSRSRPRAARWPSGATPARRRCRWAGARSSGWRGAYAAVAALAGWRAAPPRRAGRARRPRRWPRWPTSAPPTSWTSSTPSGTASTPSRQAPPRGFETPSIEPTADGWVGFNTNAPHQFAGFLRMIGPRRPGRDAASSRWPADAPRPARRVAGDGHTRGPGRTPPTRSSTARSPTACRSRRSATAARSPSSTTSSPAAPGRRARRRLPHAAPPVAHRRRAGPGARSPRPLRRWPALPWPDARRPPASTGAATGRPAAARGPAGARPHRLVGGTGGDGGARRARRRRHPRRGAGPHGRHAPGRRARSSTGRSGGSCSPFFLASTPTSATSPSTSRSADGAGAGARPRRAGRRRGRELHAAGARQARARLGRRPRRQPAGGAGAHARVRPRRPVARPARASRRHGAGRRAWRGSPATPTTSPASSGGRAIPNGGMHAVVGAARRRSSRATGPARAAWSRSTHVRRRARHRGRADHRVDAPTAHLSSGTATAARGPRRRASTATAGRRAPGWRCRWRPTTQWPALADGASAGPTSPTDRGARAPTTAGAPRHDELDDDARRPGPPTPTSTRRSTLLVARGRPGRRGRRPAPHVHATRSPPPAATTRSSTTR